MSRVARRAIGAGLAAVVLLVGIFAYVRVGWDRMESACASDAAVPEGASAASVELSWSWMPPGFTCTWGDQAVTKPWW